MTDLVNHPPHYQSDNGIECIDAIRASLGSEAFIAHCRATAMKYIWRTGKKDDAAQDISKAVWYLQRALKEMSASTEKHVKTCPECGSGEVRQVYEFSNGERVASADECEVCGHQWNVG